MNRRNIMQHEAFTSAVTKGRRRLRRRARVSTLVQEVAGFTTSGTGHFSHHLALFIIFYPRYYPTSSPSSSSSFPLSLSCKVHKASTSPVLLLRLFLFLVALLLKGQATASPPLSYKSS